MLALAGAFWQNDKFAEKHQNKLKLPGASRRGKTSRHFPALPGAFWQNALHPKSAGNLAVYISINQSI